MSGQFVFDESTLNTLVGGRSAIDSAKLNIRTLEEASNFISSYGFDIEHPNELEKLWYYHRRALVLLTETLGFELKDIPEVLCDRKKLEDLRRLLLWASSNEEQEKDLQKWSCAFLRVIHVFVHADNDLFSTFSEEIQKQILGPFQNCIFHDGKTGSTYLRSDKKEDNKNQTESLQKSIHLLGFEVKPFKTSSSTVIKLLAKPDALAMSVFDKLGVRFITKSMFDCFRVIRFLVEQNLISYPHIMPDQSHNNLYPLDLFLKACSQQNSLQKSYVQQAEVDKFFRQFLEKNKNEANFLKKGNSFSGADYQNIKFICRKLIRVSKEKGSFTFFYPFEVQIMDEAAYQKILTGPSQHHSYKERQRQGARKRLFQNIISEGKK